MMADRTHCFRMIGMFLGLAGVSARAADSPTTSTSPPEPAPAAVSAPIVETQLTLRLNPVQGRATVIAIDDATLTLVTAAHVLSSEAVGRTILLQRQEGRLSGRVVTVARNPLFHPPRARNPHELSADGTLGVDTAVVEIAVGLHDDADRRVFGRIKAADMTPQAVPGRPDQILPVRIVDQLGEEHVVRAGNHLNPKSLAWGRRGFDTRPGDSGAGVFLVRKSPAGESLPVLIGVVSQTDDRGGIASLVHRDEPWIDGALVPPPAQPK
jgi:hypothetical protein